MRRTRDTSESTLDSFTSRLALVNILLFQASEEFSSLPYFLRCWYVCVFLSQELPVEDQTLEKTTAEKCALCTIFSSLPFAFPSPPPLLCLHPPLSLTRFNQKSVIEKSTNMDNWDLWSFQLRTVPTIVIRHTFCAPQHTRVSYWWCLLIQGYFLRGLKLCGQSRTQQVLLVSQKKIGGNHAFFRYN